MSKAAPLASMVGAAIFGGIAGGLAGFFSDRFNIYRAYAKGVITELLDNGSIHGLYVGLAAGAAVGLVYALIPREPEQPPVAAEAFPYAGVVGGLAGSYAADANLTGIIVGGLAGWVLGVFVPRAIIVMAASIRAPEAGKAVPVSPPTAIPDTPKAGSAEDTLLALMDSIIHDAGELKEHEVAASENVSFRLMAALHSQTFTENLRVLAEDEDANVRKFARLALERRAAIASASDAELSTDDLLRLAESDDAYVRILARHALEKRAREKQENDKTT
jgi:hypothetical protein